MEEGDILSMEKELELKIMRDELDKFKNENIKLRLLLDEAGIESDTSGISDVEAICVRQLARLKEYSEEGDLTKDQTDIFDKLHKNLKIARGKESRVKRKDITAGLSSAELQGLLDE